MLPEMDVFVGIGVELLKASVASCVSAKVSTTVRRTELQQMRLRL